MERLECGDKDLYQDHDHTLQNNFTFFGTMEPGFLMVILAELTRETAWEALLVPRRALPTHNNQDKIKKGI